MTLENLDFVRDISFQLQKLIALDTDNILKDINISTFSNTFTIICPKEASSIIADMLFREHYDFVERNYGDGNMKLMVHMGWEED